MRLGIRSIHLMVKLNFMSMSDFSCRVDEMDILFGKRDSVFRKLVTLSFWNNILGFTVARRERRKDCLGLQQGYQEMSPLWRLLKNIVPPTRINRELCLGHK